MLDGESDGACPADNEQLPLAGENDEHRGTVSGFVIEAFPERLAGNGVVGHNRVAAVTSRREYHLVVNNQRRRGHAVGQLRGCILLQDVFPPKQATAVGFEAAEFT